MTTTTERSTESVRSALAEVDYNRQRLSPELKDNDYIPLSDLRTFLESTSPTDAGIVLDYGCGGSPYRPLFGNATYLRADYLASADLDYLISNDGILDAANESCDTVLSTQVLEHVFDPKTYLEEAWRILIPGGRLILTTHGVWEEHGCPYDFRRWTADGLQRELEGAGFEVRRLAKLTTGPRAIFFLLTRVLWRFRIPRNSLMGWLLWLLRRSEFASAIRRHQWMNACFHDRRVVSTMPAGHEIYLGLAVEAIKPRPTAR